MLNGWKRVLLLLLVISLVPGSRFGHAQGSSPTAYLYWNDLTAITVDGNMDLVEYPDAINVTSPSGTLIATLYWTQNGTHIAIGMVSDGTGWVAIGFGPIGVTMNNADVVMAAVNDDGSISIGDFHTTGQTAPTRDSDERVDPAFAAGKEVNGKTYIEFIMPMDSSDTNDQALKIGETYGIIMAYRQDSDDFTRQHTARSQTGLTFEILSQSDVQRPSSYQVSLTGAFAENTSASVLSGNLTLTATITSLNNANITGVKLSFYEKAKFGSRLLGVVETDSSGTAVLKIVGYTPYLSPDSNNVKEYSVSTEGGKEVKQSSSAFSLTFSNASTFDIQEKEESYGDLRDVLGAHFMKNFLLALVLLIVILLIYAFTRTVIDVLTLRNK